MSRPICTAVRNGEADSFCTDETGDFECYAFWHNGQQIPCPWVNDDGHIDINLLIKDAPEAALQALAARLFGEKGT